MPTIAELNQRHPSWDADEHASLTALYEGGKKFKARLDKFLVKRPGEPADRHKVRKNEAVYRNYLGPIIDYFAALLFEARPTPLAQREGASESTADTGEFYDSFREDCDHNGTTVDAFFKERLVKAMVGGCSWFRVCTPDASGRDLSTLSKAEYDDLKLGDSWLSAIDAEQVLDWEVDDDGQLEFVIVHSERSKRTTVAGGRNNVTETWQVFTASTVETYSISYERAKKPADNTDVQSDGGRAHRFGRVPMVRMRLNPALWVANRLETPQLAHFRLSNAQTWGMTATCYAMPVFKMEPENENIKKPRTVGAGYAIHLGVTESMEWSAPPSGPYAALGAEIVAHKDEIFRIAHQMALGVENNAAAVGRTAESKKHDAKATQTMLAGFSDFVKEVMECVYDMLATVRGDKFRWSIEGLDDFASVDVEGLVTVLTDIELSGGIPSATWNAIAKTRIAEATFPDLTPETKKKIKGEIEAGTDEAHELAAGMRDAQVAALEAGSDGTDDANPNGKEGTQPKASGKARAPAPGRRKKAPARGSVGASAS